MKKFISLIVLFLFCGSLLPAFAQDSYPRKPKTKESKLPSGSGQSMFMTLHQAEEALEDLRTYEVIPPDKKKESSDKTDESKPTNDQQTVKKDADQKNQPEVSKKSAEEPSAKQEKAIRFCTVCRAIDHTDDAKFCKHCGGRVR